MKKNIIFLITIIFFLIILISIFYISMSKKSRIGHTNNSQEIIENILNISSYEAIINVKVISNKNENNYIIKQKYNSNNFNSQEVIEPKNIEGTKIIKKENKLTIQNSRLNLSTVFENYQYISSNYLDLISFIKDYQKENKSKYEENENEIIMYTNSDLDKTCKKRLYINKKTNLPTKLEIEWDNKKNKVYILYNEVKVN